MAVEQIHVTQDVDHWSVNQQTTEAEEVTDS
jgi:hypothetical protein